jgi:hypothetical protein
METATRLLVSFGDLLSNQSDLEQCILASGIESSLTTQVDEKSPLLILTGQSYPRLRVKWRDARYTSKWKAVFHKGSFVRRWLASKV